MVQNDPAVAHGTEVILQSFAPILKAEIEELKPLFPRTPRQATYQTVTLLPGQILSVLGFDASRQRAVVSTVSTDIWLATERSGAESALSASVAAGTSSAFNLQAGEPLELFNQASLFIANAGTVVHSVSILIESHAIV